MQISRQQPIYIAPTSAPRPMQTVGISHAQPAFGASKPKPPEAKKLPWYTRVWNALTWPFKKVAGAVLEQWWLLTDPTFKKMLFTLKTIDVNRVATHELGHLLVDYALGERDFDKITVEPNSHSGGSVKVNADKSSENIKKDPLKGMFQLITSLSAGESFDFIHHSVCNRRELTEYQAKIKKLGTLGWLLNHDLNRSQDNIRLLTDINKGINPKCNEGEILQGAHEVVETLYQVLDPERLDKMTKDLVARKTIEGPDNIRAFIDKHLKGVDWQPVQEKFDALIEKTRPKKQP